MKIINSEKKMKLLPKEHTCKEKFENKYLEDEKCHKVRDHCRYTEEYRGAAHCVYMFKIQCT